MRQIEKPFSAAICTWHRIVTLFTGLSSVFQRKTLCTDKRKKNIWPNCIDFKLFWMFMIFHWKADAIQITVNLNHWSFYHSMKISHPIHAQWILKNILTPLCPQSKYIHIPIFKYQSHIVCGYRFQLDFFCYCLPISNFSPLAILTSDKIKQKVWTFLYPNLCSLCSILISKCMLKTDFFISYCFNRPIKKIIKTNATKASMNLNKSVLELFVHLFFLYLTHSAFASQSADLWKLWQFAA